MRELGTMRSSSTKSLSLSLVGHVHYTIMLRICLLGLTNRLLVMMRSSTSCQGWRAVHNRIKVVIGNAKRAFLNTALSSKQP